MKIGIFEEEKKTALEPPINLNLSSSMEKYAAIAKQQAPYQSRSSSYVCVCVRFGSVWVHFVSAHMYGYGHFYAVA